MGQLRPGKMPEMPDWQAGLGGHRDPFRLYGSHTFQLILQPDSAMVEQRKDLSEMSGNVAILICV
jgi:hypothetical protein